MLTLLLGLLILFSTERGEAEDSVAWVSAIEGLRMRTEPSTEAPKLVTIPFGEQVSVKETKGPSVILSNEPGQWTRIVWKDTSGWVFGGFLRNYDFLVLKEKTADIFRKKYTIEFGEQLGPLFDEHAPLTRIKPSQIVFKSVLQNLYVVERPAPEKTSPGVSRDRTIWMYHDNSWTMLIEYAGMVYLTYLDSDTIPEIISITGCCVSNDTRVYRKRGNFYKEIQFLDLSGEARVEIAGPCNKTVIYHIPCDAASDKEYYKYIFNCKADQFEMVSQTIKKR